MLTEELMTELGKAFRLPPLHADASGAYRIAFDDVAVRMRHDDAAAVLTIETTVAQADAEDSTQHESLLTANFFGDGPGGASLAIDAGMAIILTRRLRLEQLEFEEFTKALQLFVNYAEYWAQRLSGKSTRIEPWNSGGIDPSMFFIRG